MLRMCSVPKLLKLVTLLPFTDKAIQWVPVDYAHQDLLHMAYPLF